MHCDFTVHEFLTFPYNEQYCETQLMRERYGVHLQQGSNYSMNRHFNGVAWPVTVIALMVFMLYSMYTPARGEEHTPPSTFKPASPSYTWEFTGDHGEHREYANEWWYHTGHLQVPQKNGKPSNQTFGYEATLFRAARPLSHRISPETSAWVSPQLYLTHIALTDVKGKRFIYASAVERDNPYHPVVTVHPWRLRTQALTVNHQKNIRAGDPIWDLTLRHREFLLKLRLVPEKTIAYHGDKGYSKKGDCASCASMYYSYTRLNSVGELSFIDPAVVHQKRPLKVTGKSWFDHEFGSSQLTEKQVGWDWFAIQLTNKRELMVYRMRQKDGSISPQSGGSLVLSTGDVLPLKHNDIQVEPLAEWKSKASGTTYPSEWKIKVPKYHLELHVEPKLANQELYFPEQKAYSYWEGACKVTGTQDKKPVNGNAYVELAGYNGKLKF
jgi:predicted secreted hydrolase